MKILSAFFILSALCSTLSAASKPNVIVIFCDDLGRADLGAQGIRKDIRTPNLDALAKGGLLATSGYVTAPQCVPSRAGLLSGRYQTRFGVESNGAELSGFDAQTTIPMRLKKAGYATGMTGKWHLGPEPYSALQQGFDVDWPHHSEPGPTGSYVASWKFPAALHVEGKLGEHI